jgi:hypothetical protein
MKVAEIIERLNRDYQPDTELYVEWWDKETVESFVSQDDPITDDDWVRVVEKMEDGERQDQSMVADAFIDMFYDVTEEVREEK